MLKYHLSFGLGMGLASHAAASAVTYPVPATVPTSAVELDPYPIGPSFEFFMWPSYMTNISLTLPCLSRFSELYGKTAPIRIGGTTQDRATYDPDLDAYVSYHVDDPLEAPMTLTYGPKYFDLIPGFGAKTMLGFNRGDNNRTNTFQAALAAKSKALDYLDLIELGNEPDLYYYYWGKPVAVAPWNETQEGADAADWAQDFLDTWGTPSPILSGGGYALPGDVMPDMPSWPNLKYLITEAYNESVKAGTKAYCGHLYALSNSTVMAEEMNHSKTVSDLSHFPEYVALSAAEGRKYILGETGFHGLDDPMDAKFGGALQVIDKTLWAMSIGIQRLYYHQGTINQAFFNWWSSSQVELPFYGSYMAALALHDGDHIVATDPGTGPYAQYVIYRCGKPLKAILINTDYYSGTGERGETTFTLTGLKKGLPALKALRMTAPSSEVNASSASSDPAQAATIGGQVFDNENCNLVGEQDLEQVKVVGGRATFVVAASEALLVYL
ncbi:uncharacterized protein DNG_03530 [Cephalotrichum gorgonifer]|uniref:Beta-glucuronidase C-terminal domain-containing protein n=1 Tax=Cephalotrichum gorgonifer TaxID=2041049 RepID=A0AAE8MWF3_9PEZI|nr:uncharacterized protein DNG_03530 [Cephalotrichum gorgonifer]